MWTRLAWWMEEVAFLLVEHGLYGLTFLVALAIIWHGAFGDMPSRCSWVAF